MFRIFKQKCPICKMELKEGEKHPEGFGKRFCSENCREEYRKTIVKEQSHKSHGCCH